MTYKGSTFWYVVYFCGCTDCFPHAIFAVESDAEEWAKLHCKNPEGFLIKEKTTEELALLED